MVIFAVAVGLVKDRVDVQAAMAGLRGIARVNPDRLAVCKSRASEKVRASYNTDPGLNSETFATLRFPATRIQA